jgi:hypothetical protein
MLAIRTLTPASWHAFRAGRGGAGPAGLGQAGRDQAGLGQVGRVGLADQVGAEAAVRLGGGKGEAVPQVDAARGGQHVVGPQLHPRVAGPAAVDLGDPGRLADRVAGAGVVGHDAGDQGLERGVPAELGRVGLAVRHDDPAQVTWLSQLADDDVPARLLVAHVPAPPATETSVSVR